MDSPPPSYSVLYITVTAVGAIRPQCAYATLFLAGVNDTERKSDYRLDAMLKETTMDAITLLDYIESLPCEGDVVDCWPYEDEVSVAGYGKVATDAEVASFLASL